VSLTFDDGPDPVNTPKLLALLRQYHVTATFFVIGEKAAEHPELVRQEIAAGHRVENHTWDHPHLTKLSAEDIGTQIFGTTSAIESAGAPAPTLFRPPYGEANAVVDRVVRQQHLQLITWTIDSNDWRGHSATQIADTVLSQIQAGAVVLAHDGIRDSTNTLAALPHIIRGLRADGFCTTTAPNPAASEVPTGSGE
jgi:peptidoglycan/xylan/chitin deacetylase (PgdA/CDA1 family)